METCTYCDKPAILNASNDWNIFGYDPETGTYTRSIVCHPADVSMFEDAVIHLCAEHAKKEFGDDPLDGSEFSPAYCISEEDKNRDQEIWTKVQDAMGI